MKKAQASSDRGRWRRTALWVSIVLLAAAPLGCNRKTPEKKLSAAAPGGQIPPDPLPGRALDRPVVSQTLDHRSSAFSEIAKREESHHGRLVYATWYAVPPDSLAARRAAPDEYTAAHNRLPIGTQVRVTNPTNGRSVIVRITDRGIPRHASQIDLCKQAAEELGIVRAGRVKMRIEVLPDDKKLGALSDTRSAAPHP